VRVGETVRRPPHRNSEYVRALLEHLDAVGFGGAPRFLGIDDQGREILSYIQGEVHDGVLADPKLVSAAQLIRRFHDATAGTALAGGAEIVSHGDLGQHNIVFRGEQAVAIIDWDEDVGPGSRLVDFGHAVWCLAEVGEQGGHVREQARRIRLLCDAYGWADPRAVVDEIEARLARARDWHGQRGFDEGVRIFTGMLDWMAANGPAIRSSL
jgi:aminoglycoside phosphotransferase (APT) family kinase protein